jgi:hypothetical protein
VSQSVSEKAKLIRGDPPKIDFKKKGEPPKYKKFPNFRTFLFKLRAFVYFVEGEP